MTNKRKKLVRSVSSKTGMSHAEVANHLRDGLRVEIGSFDWEVFFEDDLVTEEGTPPPETLSALRVAWPAPVYKKPPGEIAYLIGEEGEHLLMIQRAKNVIVPMSFYDNMQAVIDRRVALIEAHSIQSEPLPVVPRKEVRQFFLREFAGSTGTVKVRPAAYKEDVMIGVLGIAGIVCWADEVKKIPNNVGMVVFANKIKSCRIEG